MSQASRRKGIQADPSNLAGQYLLNKFQAEVEKTIKNYRELTTYSGAKRMHRGTKPPQRVKRTKYKDVEIMEGKVKKLVVRSDIRKYVCPALNIASNDALEIAKLVTPIILTLIYTGKITMEPEPLFIASICITIARMGVATICEDYAPNRMVIRRPKTNQK